MKKLFSSLLVILTTFVLMATLGLNVKADEEIIDLYPDEDINHLKGGYGNSNWVLDFAGYRYHTVSFMARFASNFTNINDEGKEKWKGSEIPHVSANAMGGFIHNDSDRDVILEDGDRSALTGVINRVWAIFDEEGRLAVFEDHINVYYIKEVAGEDYFRLATPEEIKEFDDAEDGEKPSDMRHIHIRMVLNEDNETYKIEPLGYLKWEHQDYVPAGDGVEEQGEKSTIFDYNPREIHLNKGWTALHFSTWDRGKDKFNALIASMPELLASQDETMELNYLNPAPTFVNLKEKDVNKGEEGVNFVYSVNSQPIVSMLTDEVEARHVNETQSKKGQHTKVDYLIRIFDENKTEIETVEVTYDKDAKKYVPNKEVLEELDTSVFGARYYAEFEAVQLESDNETSYVTGDKIVVDAIIDVGVLPIHFTGVENVFIDEGLPIDLLKGIKAYDNANDLNDISGSLNYSIVNRNTGSSHFNIYNVKAGDYDVTVNAEYIYGETLPFDEDTKIEHGDKSVTVPVGRINHSADPFSYNAAGSMFTDASKIDLNLFATQGDKWGIYMALVDATGKVTAYYDYDNKVMTFKDGTKSNIAAVQKKEPRMEWLNALDFEDGEKLLLSSTTTDPLYTFLKGLDVGSELEGLGKTYLVEGSATYRLTVTDITPPKVRVKQETLTIYTDSTFKNAEEAALSNIEIFEEHGYTVTVPGANRMDITNPAEHNVRVIVIDNSGNETEVSFKILVKEAKVSESEKDDLEDELRDANNALEKELNDAKDKIKDLEDALTQAEKDIKDKREGTSVTTVIVVALVTAVVSIGASAGLVFLRKP